MESNKCVIAYKDARVLTSSALGYVWGHNFYDAAEFQDAAELKKEVPKGILDLYEWRMYAFPDSKWEQRKKAEKFGLAFAKDLNLTTLNLPDYHTKRYYSICEVVAIVGLNHGTLRKYYKYLGEIKAEKTWEGKPGRKKKMLSTEQVNMIFRIRLHNPNLKHSTVLLKYEEWLSTVS